MKKEKIEQVEQKGRFVMHMAQGWQNAGKYEYFPCRWHLPVNTGIYWQILANTGKLNLPQKTKLYTHHLYMLISIIEVRNTNNIGIFMLHDEYEFGNGVNSAVLEVIITRNFPSSRINQV